MLDEMAPGNGIDYAKELEDYKERCLELEEKNKKAETRRLVLELEVGNLKKKKDELEEQIMTIQKVVGKGENGTDDEHNGDNKFVLLMVENKVLEYEKTKAENELNTWKEKVTELVSRVCELESKVNTKAVNESTGGIKDGQNPVTGETHLDTNSILIGKAKVKGDEDGFTNKKMAPSTPGVAQPHFSHAIGSKVKDANFDEISVVKRLSDSSDPERIILEDSDDDGMDVFGGHSSAKRKRAFKIITSDDENGNSDEQAMDMDGFKGHSPVSTSVKRKRAFKIIMSVDENGNNDEEGMDMDRFKGHSPVSTSVKRKRAFKIVTSDEETSYEDNAPICTLMTLRKKTYSGDEVKEDVSRQRLMRPRKLETKNEQDRNDFDLNKPICLNGNTSSEDDEDEDGVENDSENEGESLGGFIVNSSESACDSSFESDESKDALDDYRVTLDKIRRKRVSNLKWDLEGDMLADFGKDPELCMRAVCAIYRQQTADEKLFQGTLHANERGFSQCDATRGSKLAEFLTDGDSRGDLNRTVEELKQYDPKGIKLCMALATKYSKQLFEIYQNKEDPYFLPP